MIRFDNGFGNRYNRRIMSNIIYAIQIALIVILLLLIIHYAKKVRSPLRSESHVDQTALVLENVKAMAKLVTAEYDTETYVLVEKPRKAFDDPIDNSIAKLMGRPNGLFSKKLNLYAHGVVSAGYDFRTLTENDLFANGDTVYIRMPQVQTYEPVINPSDQDIQMTGDWSDDEKTAAKEQAKNDIVKKALTNGLLKTAQASGEEQMEKVLKSFGFGYVYFLGENEPIPGYQPTVHDKCARILPPLGG